MATGKISLSFLMMFVLSVVSYSAEKSVIYHIRLDSEINALAQKTVVMGLQKANEANADYIILEIGRAHV